MDLTVLHLRPDLKRRLLWICHAEEAIVVGRVVAVEEVTEEVAVDTIVGAAAVAVDMIVEVEEAINEAVGPGGDDRRPAFVSYRSTCLERRRAKEVAHGVD